VLFITHDQFWRKFCEEAKRPQWLTDERFATMAARRANREVVLAALAELLATGTAAHWVERLAPLGVVISTVETLEDALGSDLARSRAMVVDLPCTEAHLRASARRSSATERRSASARRRCSTSMRCNSV
jgi:crotonobetainyl-CoA:carnitine CoA-transferase CaiB-like acyl-CoA transferase